MSGPAKNGATVKKKGKPGAPIEYITPPNVLKAKLRSAVTSIEDPVAKAEKALTQLGPQMGDWIKQEIQELDKLRKAYKAEPNNETADALHDGSLNIKGLAPTCGNDTAARFAASLCRMLADAPEGTTHDAGLIDAHVDAIRATAAGGGANEKVAEALAQELESKVELLVGDASAA